MCSLQKNAEFTWTGEKVDCPSDITWGIAEQSNGLWALLLNTPGGVINGKQMRAMAEIVGDDGLIKNSRRMAPLLLVPKERITEALEKLEQVGLRIANLHSSLRNIVSCPGKGFSKNSRGNTLELAQILDQEFYGAVLPWDFKIGISGCPRNCAGVQCQDLGLMAEMRGKFSLWLGGSESGMAPKHGTLICKGIPSEKVPAVVRRVMELYSEGAEKYKEQLGNRVRLYYVIEQTGIDFFAEAVKEIVG